LRYHGDNKEEYKTDKMDKNVKKNEERNVYHRVHTHIYVRKKASIIRLIQNISINDRAQEAKQHHQ